MRYDRERQEARVYEIVGDLKRVAKLIRFEILDDGAPHDSTIAILDKLLRDLYRHYMALVADWRAEKV